MKKTLRLALAGDALCAASLASAQTPTLLDASYDVAREVNKDFNTA